MFAVVWRGLVCFGWCSALLCFVWLCLLFGFGNLGVWWLGLLLLLCWIWLRCFGLLRLGFRVGRVFLCLLGAVLCILVVLDLVCCLFAGVLCVGLGLVLLSFGCGMLCICLCIIVVDGLRVLGIGFV